jgi:hypothetical protein
LLLVLAGGRNNNSSYEAGFNDGVQDAETQEQTGEQWQMH